MRAMRRRRRREMKYRDIINGGKKQVLIVASYPASLGICCAEGQRQPLKWMMICGAPASTTTTTTPRNYKF